MEESIECLFFDKAYEVYDKWMRVLKRQPQPPKTLELLYKDVFKALVEWFLKREKDVEDKLQFMKQIGELYESKLETLKEQLQEMRIDLRVKEESREQTEQEIKINNKFINESQTLMEDLKKESEESNRIRKNTENQKNTYNGL